METRFTLDSHRHDNMMRSEDPLKVLEAVIDAVTDYNKHHGKVEP